MLFWLFGLHCYIYTIHHFFIKADLVSIIFWTCALFFFVDVLQFWNRSHSQPNIIPEVFSYHLKKSAAVSREFTWKLQISSDCKIYIEYTWILLLHHSACWELCLIPSKLSKVCRDLKLHRLSQGPSESKWLAFAVVPTGGLLGRSYDKSRRSTRWSSTRCLGSPVLPRFFIINFASGIQAGHYSCPQLMIPHGATQGDLHGSFYPHGRVPARALV